MEKNVEKSFIKIGLYFQIAYIVLMAITLCGFVICYGLIFGLFYLLSGSRADYLIVNNSYIGNNFYICNYTFNRTCHRIGI